MSRKVWSILALVTTVLTVLPAPKVEAHYIVVSGRLLYHSLSCEEVLKGVKNPDTNPSQVTCTVTGTVVETLCQNPANQDVAPGKAATQITFIASEPLSSEDFNKKKGEGSVRILISDEATLGVTSADGCVNPNWNIIKALVRSADVRLDAYTCGQNGICGDADDILASITTLQCTLPASVDFNTVVPEEGIGYNCPIVSFTHVK
jgi:hypothetical protein